LKVLIVDNNDSFSYNLKHYVEQFSAEVKVIRGIKLDLNCIDEFDKIILSPGPGLPSEHPILSQILDKVVGNKSILGICLGHQAIAEYFGATLANLKQVKHGVTSQLKQYKNCKVFKNLPECFEVAHYHSWIVEKESFPDCLIISSENKEGMITSFKHKIYDVTALQFHPESILTEHGLQMIKNWVLV